MTEATIPEVIASLTGESVEKYTAGEYDIPEFEELESVENLK
jgi:hypothetical protein